MYGGRSGCYGIVVYNTEVEGENAVYGYYKDEEMCFEKGTVEEMNALKGSQEKELDCKDGITGKLLVSVFFVYLAVSILGFVVLPLRIAVALLVFCAVSYFPVLVIKGAVSGLYSDQELRTSFRRFHGCEHAIINALTKKLECTEETLRQGRFYDSECGTAYSGYAVALAMVLSLLIIFWPGFLKAAGLLLLSVIIILIMIIFPKINPFTVIQRPVVLRPTEREIRLGIEIMKRVKEL